MKKILLSVLAFTTIVSADDFCGIDFELEQNQIVEKNIAMLYEKFPDVFRDKNTREYFLSAMENEEKREMAKNTIEIFSKAKCLASRDLFKAQCEQREKYIKGILLQDKEEDAEKFYDKYIKDCKYAGIVEADKQNQIAVWNNMSSEEHKTLAEESNIIYMVANNIYMRPGELAVSEAGLKASEGLSRTKTLLKGNQSSTNIAKVGDKITASKVNSEIVDATAFEEATKKGLVKDSNAYEVKTKVAEKDANKGMNASTSQKDISKATYTKKADEIKKTKSSSETASKSHSSKRD